MAWLVAEADALNEDVLLYELESGKHGGSPLRVAAAKVSLGKRQAARLLAASEKRDAREEETLRIAKEALSSAKEANRIASEDLEAARASAAAAEAQASSARQQALWARWAAIIATVAAIAATSIQINELIAYLHK